MAEKNENNKDSQKGHTKKNIQKKSEMGGDNISNFYSEFENIILNLISSNLLWFEKNSEL
jgi:hypothetical protein